MSHTDGLTPSTLYDMISAVQKESENNEKTIKSVLAEMDSLTKQIEGKEIEIEKENKNSERLTQLIEEETELQIDLRLQYTLSKEWYLKLKHEDEVLRAEFSEDFRRFSLWDRPVCDGKENEINYFTDWTGETALSQEGGNAAARVFSEPPGAAENHTTTTPISKNGDTTDAGELKTSSSSLKGVLQDLQRSIPTSVPPEVLVDYLYTLHETLSQDVVLQYLTRAVEQQPPTRTSQSMQPPTRSPLSSGEPSHAEDVHQGEEKEEDGAERGGGPCPAVPLKKRNRLSFESDLEVVIPVSGKNPSRPPPPTIHPPVPVPPRKKEITPKAEKVGEEKEEKREQSLEEPTATLRTSTSVSSTTTPEDVEGGKRLLATLGGNITRFVMPFSLSKGNANSTSRNRRNRRTVWKLN